MSDERATDEQLDRIERGVLRRIDRRVAVAAVVRRSAAALIVLVVLGGGITSGVALLAAHSGTSGASSGTGAYSAPERIAVRCHESSAADSASQLVPVRAVDARTVTEACSMPAPAAGGAPSARPSRTADAGRAPVHGAALDVVCRDHDGMLNAFPADAHPTTLCVRNGMRTP